MDTKDYTLWHERKTWLNNEKPRVFFHEREVWWCSLGSNVGFEQDGKGAQFSRPVLVFKKFNNEVFWAIPFTTKNKAGKFYSLVDVANVGRQSVVLSQIRLVDSKRLLTKLGNVSKRDYAEIQKAIMNLCES
jgi:mRNA interferase MazF